MTTPELFPLEDTSYNLFNDIGIRNNGLWVYTNEHGQGMFIKWRHEPKHDPKAKSIYPVSKQNGKWCNKLGWKGNHPPLHLHKIVKTKLPLLVVEGEGVVDSAQALLPNYCVTTWPNGASQWHKTNWSWLKDKNVTFWGDNDNAGINAVNGIARLLCDKYRTPSKIVKIPRRLDKGWDLADYTEDTNIDIADCLSKAEWVKEFNYEDINSDIDNKRWVFIKQSRKSYYDRFKKTFDHKETINELYKRDFDLGKLHATTKLHQEDIDVVDATAFWPSNEEYIFEGNKKYLNTYRPQVFDPFNVKVKQDDIKVFREHLKLICNYEDDTFNYLEDIIAHDLQFPEVNRLFAVLIQGDYGLGKSIIFEAITRLMGNENTIWVRSDAFADKFRDWLKKCCVICCNEFNFEKYNKFGSNAYGMMNEIITEDKHFVESKGIDQYQHKGHYKVWLASNDAVPIKLNPRDRRYFVTKIHTTKKMILKKDPEYYKKLWEFVEDPESIRKLYWYYKSSHKISQAFNPKEPLMTSAKRILINESTEQVFRDLDDLFHRKEGPFEFDLVNSTRIINYVRERENGMQGIPNPRSIFSKLTQHIITEWIQEKEGVPIKNGQPIPISPDDLETKTKRHYYAIRNQDHWFDCQNLDELRAHMKGKVKVAKEEKQLPF